MGRVTDDVMRNWENTPRRISVSSFYMDETEVKKLDWQEYMYWVKRIYNDDYPEVFQASLPDTLVWRDKLAYNEPYVDYYFRHPAYNEYPVVGVDWLPANDYCVWRTARVNEMRLIEEGILDMETNQI